MKSFTNYLLKLIFLFILSLDFQTNVSAQSTVVIPADFQSEVGCSGDWMPDCDATRLTQTSPGIWEGTFLIPAGAWQYKVAYDNSWNENYGEGGMPGGPNMWLILGSPTSVHFTYSSYTHLVNLSFITPSVTLAGDFLNEIGCPGDWMPDCAASNLFYDAGSNLWYGVFAIPPGNWEYKVVVNNSWAENYGLGGVLNGPNIPLIVSGDKKILFRYDPVTHIVTTTTMNYSVVLAGDFQNELGCPGDWQPDCPLTGLAFDPANNLWKGDFTVPAGNWQFKVTLDDSWIENYGEGGVLNGPNFSLNLSATSKLSVVFNPDTHILTYETESVTVVIPGSFQTELGCASDWDPACDNTRLVYDKEKKAWTGTFDIPAGNWEFKVAYNNSWVENYGDGGVRNGPNIYLNLEMPANITFSYDPQSHILTLLYNTTGLCVTAFYDVNANGYKDYFEEVPMEGIQFTLEEQVVTQFTGSDGKTCFTNLTPGFYTVKETMPPGYFPTTVDSQTVFLNEPQTLNFGMVCLGGAGAENIAFWMNKKGTAAFEQLPYWQQDYIFYLLRFLNLRNSDGTDFDPWSYEELSVWLQRSNAKNMAYKLSAQMAVLFLNAEIKMLGYRMIHTPGLQFWGINYNFMDVNLFLWAVNQELFSNSFGGDANREYHQYLYEIIEQANNDLTFVQLQPCGSNMITSVKKREAGQLEINTLLPVQIWPNPSTNQFNLRLSNGTGNEQVQIKVMDVQGRQVYTITGSNQREYQFGNNFMPGLYFIEVMQGSNRTNFKVIKL